MSVTCRTERVRVLFLHGALGIGGAEEVRLVLLSHLDRSRYDVKVCCLQMGGPLAEEIAAAGCEVTVLGHRADAFSVRTLLELRRLIRAYRPHVVQTSLPRANYWGRLAAALERVPVVISEEHSVRQNADWARPAIDWALDRKTDCRIAVSESVRAALEARRRTPAPCETVVLPNAVNAARLQPRRSRAVVRAELGVVEEDFLCAHTGRMANLAGEKGHDLLLGAMSHLAGYRPRIVLALLGDGAARPGLEAMASELGVRDRVVFLGYRRDVADYLAAADVFVLPSRWEGQPVALLEAAWLGLPVLASDIPATREVLVPGGYGELVPSPAPEAWADAIRRLAADPARRKAMGAKAQLWARDTFSPQAYADRVAELWEKLLAHSPVAGECSRRQPLETTTEARVTVEVASPRDLLALGGPQPAPGGP